MQTVRVSAQTRHSDRSWANASGRRLIQAVLREPVDIGWVGQALHELELGEESSPVIQGLHHLQPPACSGSVRGWTGVLCMPYSAKSFAGTASFVLPRRLD
eukprot:scaffold2865_cov356-Prasinococcus_capsulatus_cf.AAC.5